MSASNLPNHVSLEVVRILDLWGARMWRAHARSFMRCWRPTQASATIGSTIACFLSLPTTASSSMRACTPGIVGSQTSRQRLWQRTEPWSWQYKRRRRTSVGGSASTCSQRDCVHVGSARRMACARSPHGADKKHSVDLLRGLSPLGLSLPICRWIPNVYILSIWHAVFHSLGADSGRPCGHESEGPSWFSRAAPSCIVRSGKRDERVAEQDQTHGLKQHENVEKQTLVVAFAPATVV